MPHLDHGQLQLEHVEVSCRGYSQEIDRTDIGLKFDTVASIVTLKNRQRNAELCNVCKVSSQIVPEMAFECEDT